MAWRRKAQNGWNNARYGHSALMELNYTPQKKDGSISIEKAVEINEAFQISPVLVFTSEQRRVARSALLHQHRAARPMALCGASRQ